MMKQVTINFDESPFQGFNTCREYVQARSYQQKHKFKYIAAEMDYAPSQLSRKLSQHEDDSARFTLDDFEKWLSVNKDMTPVYMLLERHSVEQTDEEIQAEIERLKARLKK